MEPYGKLAEPYRIRAICWFFWCPLEKIAYGTLRKTCGTLRNSSDLLVFLMPSWSICTNSRLSAPAAMTNTHVFGYHCPRRPCACVHFCEMLLTEHLRMPYGWLTEVSAGRNREKKTTALPPCSRHPPSTAEQHWWCACWLVQETLPSIWKHPPCLDLSESTNVRPRLKRAERIC